ncbi:SusC/RagA family TonB-linked outer membrane protein [Mucilaginibacter sp. SP1R1]|uniref:SusC/RagA family TonB-linked outer membrane protein n=1 Tax=Mucilaginibacter sp. SP1R1 TaxID=2723091 RepID=UPI00160FA864|nr:SusC/RagA family TonB-linked outer membrane protein [Mucilaginibacter sp. SP1R1]MBB6148423.1 TonB-linked SusC/RagA family outer membrane protein [Mucilaginibacter sp. SP1R1]
MIKHIRVKWLLLFIFLCPLATFAQQQQVVHGIVRDLQGALPGVSVRVKNSSRGTISDGSGSYAIKADNDETLIFSFVGYNNQEIQVKQSSVNVTLVKNDKQLGEVVVVALGLSRNKNELPYSAQTLSGAEVSSNRNTNLLGELSGKIAGAQIRQSNVIGGSTNIVLRGPKSLSGSNQPLFVVDGVPIDNSSDLELGGRSNVTENQRNGKGGYDYGSPGADINPDDVASITVLKGAASTALYGSRAANGAIIITTKKGSKGLNVVLNTGVQFGTVDKSTFAKYQKDYGAGYGPYYDPNTPGSHFDYTDILGNGQKQLVVPTYDDASYGQKFDPALKVYDWRSLDPTSPYYHQQTLWVAAKNDPSTFFNHPYTLNNSLFIDGGTDKGNYKIGYTRSDDHGILPNSSIGKNLFNFGGSYRLTDKLTVQANVNYSTTAGQGRGGTGFGGQNGEPMNILQNFREFWQGNVDVKDLKDAYFRTNTNNNWNVKSPTDLSSAYWDNPYFVQYQNYETDGRDRFFGNVSLDYKLFSWLDILGRASEDYYNEFQEQRINVGSVVTPSSYYRLNRTYKENNYDLLLNFNKAITHDISFKGVLGLNARRQNIQSISASTNGGLVVPGLFALSNSVNPIDYPVEEVDQKVVTGVFGGATFGYKDLFFLDGTLRRDQSTTLPDRNNTYYYPSVAGSFVFSNLLKNYTWLSSGKLKLNYAEVGNDAPSRRISEVYDKATNFNSQPLYYVSTVRNNADLKPERTKSFETGLDASFFQSRLGFDVTFYKNNTINQILPVSVSTATGYDGLYVNSGNVQNKGIEVALNGSPIKTNDFSWNINVNFAKNENKVLSLYNGVSNYQLAAYKGGVTTNATVGEAYGTLRGTDFIYKNGQKEVDATGHYLFTSNSNNVIGNTNPDWTGGVYNSVRYKNFTLSFLVDFSHGGSIYDVDMVFGLWTGLYPETAGLNDLGNPKRNSLAQGGGVILPGVHADGTPNSTRIDASQNQSAYGYQTAPNKAFVYDASYIKLREASISYSIPASFVQKIGAVKAIDVSINGRNLWIIHKNIPYADPEDGLGAGSAYQGVQLGSYPNVRRYGFNLKFSF